MSLYRMDASRELVFTTTLVKKLDDRQGFESSLMPLMFERIVRPSYRLPFPLRRIVKCIFSSSFIFLVFFLPPNDNVQGAIHSK